MFICLDFVGSCDDCPMFPCEVITGEDDSGDN